MSIRTAFLAVVVSALVAGSALGTTTLTNGLLAYWRFEETNTLLTSGVFVDATGNGNDLSAQNDPHGDGANGFFGGGLHCDHIGPYDRAYATNDIGKFNLTNESFTMAMWFKPADPLNDFHFYGGWADHADNLRWSLCNAATRTKMRFRLQGKGGASHELISDSDPLVADQWVFMAVTYDAGAYAETTNVTVTLYADDAVVAQDDLYLNPAATWGPTNPAVPFSVGARHFDAAGGVDGDLDEVGLWNRVLTADELAQLYNAGGGHPFVVPEADSLLDGLDAYWAFEETSGSFVDASGNGNTLEPLHNPWGDGANGLYGGGMTLNDVTAADRAYGTNTVGQYNLTNESFSVSFWVRKDEKEEDFEWFVGWAGGSTLPSRGWAICNGPSGSRDELRFRVKSQVSGNNQDTGVMTTDGPRAVTDEWIFVAATYDTSAYAATTNVAINLYVNGRLSASDDALHLAPTSIWSPTNPAIVFSVGARKEDGSGRFAGDMDEVGLWNRVLTFEEIGRLYNGGHGYRAFTVDGDEVPLAVGLDAYWPFDESGGNFRDVTGNGNDLIPDNAPYGPFGGKFRGALDLNGANQRAYATTTVGQYEVGDMWSAAAWVKLDNPPPGNANFKWFLGWEQAAQEGWSLRDAGPGSREDAWLVWLKSGPGGGWGITKEDVLATTDWVFLTCTHDGRGHGGDAVPGVTNGVVSFSLYVNGIQVGSGENQTYDSESQYYPGAEYFFSVGARDGSYGGAIDGRIDEVGLWSRELFPEEVWALYNFGKGYRDFIVATGGSVIVLN
jgi:hypothetical protein